VHSVDPNSAQIEKLKIKNKKSKWFDRLTILSNVEGFWNHRFAMITSLFLHFAL